MNTTLRLWDGYQHTSGQLQPEVRKLQELLNNAGRGISVDGYFGPGTEAAVIEFQRMNSLEQDGIVGVNTWSALYGEEAPVASTRETTYSMRDKSMLAQLKAAKKYSDFIYSAATLAQVHVSIICGIGSRESHWGLALRPPGPAGTGDFVRRNNMTKWRVSSLPPDGGGFGRGLMQIDYDAHDFARQGDWADPKQNIRYGGQVLSDNIRYFLRKDKWSPEEVLRMAIAAYNCGPNNVMKAVGKRRSIDHYTANRNYSRDVLDRAGWFELAGWN